MRYSKIGIYYTYKYETEMLEAANELEAEGYKVKREYDEYFDNYKVTIIGYR